MNTPIVAVTGLNRGENPQPGYAVARSLRRKFPGIRIVGLLYDAMESGIFADDGPDWAYTIPYPTASARALLERLDFVRERHPFSVLIPTLDSEIEWMIRMQPELASRGVRCFLPTLDAFRARSKASLGTLCAACGCSTPATKAVRTAHEAIDAAEAIGFPVMVKGQFYDARKVRTEGELIDAFEKTIQDWGVPVLVQECVQGEEFNVLGVGDGAGDATGLCAVRKTALSSKGKAISAVTVHEPRLNAIARRIVEELRWRGPFELEFIEDLAAETFQLIEMNPRFPAWADFPSAFGLNFPAQVLSLVERGIAEPGPELAPGRFYLRHQVELFGSMDQLGRLLTEGVWEPARKPS